MTGWREDGRQWRCIQRPKWCTQWPRARWVASGGPNADAHDMPAAASPYSDKDELTAGLASPEHLVELVQELSAHEEGARREDRRRVVWEW